MINVKKREGSERESTEGLQPESEENSCREDDVGGRIKEQWNRIHFGTE